MCSSTPAFRSCALLTLLLSSVHAVATPPSPVSPYVEIPFSGNLEEALFRQLQNSGGTDQMQKLVEQYLKKASVFGLDPQKILQMATDPRDVKQIQDLLKNKDKLDTEAWQAAWMKMLDKAKGSDGKIDFGNISSDRNSERSLPPDANDADAEERMQNWAKNLSEWLEENGWGDFVRDSPALQRILREIDPSMLGRQSKNWGRWLPDMKRLDNIKWPAINLPTLRVGRPSFGGWADSMPKFNSMPTMGEMGSLWVIGWVFVIVAAGVLTYTWLARSWIGFSGKNNGAPARWPVEPNQVATRAQLVQAFDFLALTRLGPQARPWNHLQIFLQWVSADANEQAAMQRLTGFYEEARYSQSDDNLPEPIRNQARRDLCLLARMPGA